MKRSTIDRACLANTNILVKEDNHIVVVRVLQFSIGFLIGGVYLMMEWSRLVTFILVAHYVDQQQ